MKNRQLDYPSESCRHNQHYQGFFMSAFSIREMNDEIRQELPQFAGAISFLEISARFH